MTAVIIVLTVAGMAGALAHAGKMKREKQALWRQAAALRGGVVHESRGLFGTSLRGIEVDVHRTRVLLDEITRGSGDNRTTYTRVRAHYVLPAGPVFRVYRQGLLSSIGKALGTQDVTLGVLAAFDERFMVKCDDPHATRAVWTAAAQHSMLKGAAAANVSSDGAVVELETTGSVRSAPALDALLDLVGLLASADLFGLDVLAEIPGAAYTPADGTWDRRSAPRAVIDAPSPVVLQPVVTDGVPQIEARTTQGPADELHLVVRDGEIDGGPVPPVVASLLARVGDVRLRADRDGAVLTWRCPVADPARLQAGAQVLITLSAGPGRGVYR